MQATVQTETIDPVPRVPLPHLVTIDVLRGIASLLVCWYHITDNKLIDSIPILAASSTHGEVGVHIFFVISGFVLPYSLYRGQYSVSNFPRFVVKRIIRLDPPYLAAIGLAVLIPYLSSRSALHQGAVYHPDWLQLLAHLGYANALIGYPWLVGGFWTLAIEFQYYLTLALVFPALVVRRWQSVALLYLMAGLSACFFHQTQFLFFHLPLFLIGIAGFRYYALGVSKLELLLCLAYAGFLTAYTQQTFYAIIAVLACLCILFVRYTNSILHFLGEISYSLYLTHQIIFGIPLAQGVRFLGNSVPVRVTLPFVSLALCILLAWGLYRSVELPSRRLSSRLKYGGSARSREAPPVTG